MDKHTYYVGAKPAIERLVRRFDEQAASAVGSDAQRSGGTFGGQDETRRYLEEAIERHVRLYEARRARRRALRQERAKLLPVELDVFVKPRRCSGEV